MKKFTFVLAGILAIGLAACGNTRGERALSGAGVGAGVGAVGAAVTGGSVLGGAAVGGLAGGAVGGLTRKDQVSLD